MKLPIYTDYVSRTALNSQSKGDLVLFDYSKEIQFGFDWDDVSLNARGIVFEKSTGNLIARPYPKFFNFEELVGEAGNKLPERYRPNLTGECMALEKADGSCGIVYYHNNDWRVNTRGSFESEQAVWAKTFLDDNLNKDEMNPAWTYLFEIIYPENRIVVDYGNLRTLRLTGIIITETGEELWIDEMQKEAKKIGSEVVEAFAYSSLEEMFAAQKNWSVNEEGIVVTYRNGYKFKLKGEMYCNVHRALSNMTPLSFWRAIDYENTMRIPEEFLALMPEEFRSTVDALCEITENLHIDMYETACKNVDEMPNFESSPEGRKARYMWIKENHTSADMADILGILSTREFGNGNAWKVKQAIHRRVRPTSNTFNGIELDPRLQRILDES
jgi:RNA ligase